MKKYGLFLLAGLMAVAAVFAILFFCTHGSMLPEKRTEYYEQKAKSEAETATGAEAELMALLLGAAPAAPAEETEKAASALQPSPFSRQLALYTAALSLIILYVCLEKPAEHKGVLWAFILSVPLGLAGARLLYCLTDIAFYLKDIQAPAAMLNLWEGGFSLMGALAGITLAGVLGARIAGEKPFHVLNRMTWMMLVFAAAVFWANAKSNNGWGPEMSLPLLCTTVNDQNRLHTAALATLVFVAAYAVLDCLFRKNKLPQSRCFLYTAFLFGVLMVLMESLRRDGHMVWGFVHAEMLYAMLIFFPASLALVRKNRRIPQVGITALLAGAVIGLEFMLDRSAINDWLLYIVYILCLAAYIFVTLKWANRSCEAAENNV